MIDDDRISARHRSRLRRSARWSGEEPGERVVGFSVEEFEARHARQRTDPDATEPVEVEAEVVLMEPAGNGDREAADRQAAGESPGAEAEKTDAGDAGGALSGTGGRERRIRGDTGGGERRTRPETGAAAEGDTPARDVVHLDDPAEVLPALAKVAADLWLRAALWGIETSLQTGARMVRAAIDPEAAAELYQDLSGGLRAYAREFLGVTELDYQVQQLKPLAGATLPQNGERPEVTLREQGAQLLRQAADVSLEDGVHPAYARILTELAPDEARILRTLATDGPQPMVDIRETNLIGMGSQLIRSDLNMIDAQAGLRFRDRVEAYLGNLLRLGLIELSDAAVEDAIAYQVLEAQPDVMGTIKETPRAKTVHRSIRLTPFGEGFCRVCLPLDTSGPPAAGSTETSEEHLA